MGKLSIVLFVLFLFALSLFSFANHGAVTVAIPFGQVYEIQKFALILFSIAVGVFIAFIFFAIRDTKKFIDNWQYQKKQRQEIKVQELYARAGAGDHNWNHPADAREGVSSQQFGSEAAGFTGGVVQRLAVEPGVEHVFTTASKFETRQRGTTVTLRMGWDPTAQAADGNAGTIAGTADLVSAERRETDTWQVSALRFVPPGPQVSIWFAVGNGKVYVTSGRGLGAQWIKNLQKNPEVALQIGATSLKGTASWREGPSVRSEIFPFFFRKYLRARLFSWVLGWYKQEFAFEIVILERSSTTMVSGSYSRRGPT